MSEAVAMESVKKERLGRIGKRPYWVFSLSIVIRACHQIGAAVFLAVNLLHISLEPPSFYLYLAYSTGGMLLVTEWLRHRQLYREVAGLLTVLKLLLLGAFIHGLLPGKWVVVTAFVLASLGSHTPKNIRHRMLF